MSDWKACIIPDSYDSLQTNQQQPQGWKSSPRFDSLRCEMTKYGVEVTECGLGSGGFVSGGSFGE